MKLLYPLPQAALVFSGMRRHPSFACQVSNNNSLFVLESKTFKWFLSATSVCVCVHVCVHVCVCVCVCMCVCTCVCACVCVLSCVWLRDPIWTVAHEAPPSMEFSRQDYWSGLPFPSPADLPNPGIKPGSPARQADALPSEPPGRSMTLQIVSHYVVYLKHIVLPSAISQ